MIIIGVNNESRGLEIITDNSYLYDQIGRDSCERVKKEFLETGSTFIELFNGTRAMIKLNKKEGVK